MTVLVPMGEEAFREFAADAIAGYAEDNVTSGRWLPGDADERARAEFAQLAPQGLATPGHLFLEVLEAPGGASVGQLWLGPTRRDEPRAAYLYNIRVRPAYRGRGHAAAALALVEELAAQRGVTSIGLHVFAFNTRAQALYRSAGFGITGLNMLKRLRRDEA